MDGETRSAAGNSSAAQAVRNQRDGLRSARVVVGTGSGWRLATSAVLLIG